MGTSYGTRITGRDPHGRAIDSPIGIYHISGSDSDQTLAHARKTIADWCGRLQFPSMISTKATEIFKLFLDKSPVKRIKNQGALYLACIERACREYRESMLYSDIYTRIGISKKLAMRAKKFLQSVLGTPPPPVPIQEYVHRFCALLNLNSQVTSQASEMAEWAIDNAILGAPNTATVCGAAIFVVCSHTPVAEGQRRTEKEIAEVTSKAEQTIKQASQNLQGYWKQFENYMHSKQS